MAVAIVLSVLVLALVAFWLDFLPVEVTSLAVVAVLAATRVLTPAEALAGFSNETVVFIFTLLAMAQGLASTGVVQIVGHRIGWLARAGHRSLLAAIVAIVAAVSAFVSNTVTTAAFLPVVTGVAARAKVPKHEVLMPMAFASMLGGTILLFGTSTNLVMSAVIARSGLAPLGVTELAPAGLALTAAGLVLLVLLAPRLLRSAGRGDEEPAVPQRAYLAEVAVSPGSPHVGRALADVADPLGLRVVGVMRGEEAVSAHPERPVEPEDRLVVEADRDAVAQAKHASGIDVGAGPPAPSGDEPDDGSAVVVEAFVPPGSRLEGRTLDAARIPGRFGLEVLGIHRRPSLHRHTRRRLRTPDGALGASIGTLPLATGDVLLLRGAPARVRDLGDGATLLVLTGAEEEPIRTRKAGLATAIFLGALGLGSVGVLPLPVAGLAGMLLMIVTGCIEARRAFRLDWRVVLLIASMMALGLAMEKSGAGRLIGERIAGVGALGGPHGVLLALIVLTVVLSIPMSNQAAALVVFPIALSAAAHLGVAPRTFAIGVTLAASIALVTPFEPSSMLVYGVGRYRFSDFVRVGGPLTAVLIALLTFLVPALWPFQAVR